MPDKKLTDSEITIKALKEILELMLCEGDLQRTSTISHVIDLINRLKAENDRLERVNADLIKIADTRKKANFYLLAQNNELKTAKAEAYKEFAEELKKKMVKHNFKYADTLFSANVVTVPMVDNLVKEMVGE